MKYFYTDNGETAIGPLSREALLTLKAGGVIASSARVKEENAADWKSFAAIFETDEQIVSPLSSENANGITDSSIAHSGTYKNLAGIAESATLKLLLLFFETNAASDNGGIEKLFLQFLLEADDFTETCCQQYAVTLRKASVLSEVRGTPTTVLARQIRENCFSKTDGILISYLEALKSCQIDLQVAADKLEESSVLGAALRGSALGQLAGGFGKTGARLGVLNAAISGFAERDKQRELLWEQAKAQEDAKRTAGRKIIEYLIAVKDVPRSLLDFGCARAFGGRVDFELQGAALSGVEEAIGEKMSGAIARAVEISGFQDDWLDAFHGISGLIDVREQVWLDLDETMLLADRLGIAHPINPNTKQPNVVTTDFVLTLVDGMREFEIAVAVKPSADLGSARTLEKLELERLFWTARKIPWRILTEREVPRPLVKNLRWVQPHLDLVNLPGYGLEEINRIRSGMEPLIKEGNDSLVAIAAGCDDRLGLQPGSALCVARHLIGTGAWLVDLMVEINPREPLRLQSRKNKYELAA